ncbi:unnamed protein product [Hermetia illucens]|uniref:Uncharacterized protein n=1 Tax=Hermetia illucens TaxID=343691 RepID=A0A7R8YTK9_HERIL|nr:unnamed protein product [Hermetia illucens]
MISDHRMTFEKHFNYANDKAEGKALSWRTQVTEGRVRTLWFLKLKGSSKLWENPIKNNVLRSLLNN